MSPRSKRRQAQLHGVLQATILDFRQTHFAQGLVLGILFLLILAASLRVTRLWCRSICPLGALLGVASRFSVLGLHKDEASCNRCNRCLLQLPGRRRSHRRRSVAQVRMPDVHELRGRLPGPQPCVSLLPQRERSRIARPESPQDADRPCRRSRGRSAHARQHRARQRPPRTAAAPARLARRKRSFSPAAFAAASA